METILEFFSDLILFTAGVIVSLAWVLIVIIIIDEIIDLAISFRNKDKEEEK